MYFARLTIWFIFLYILSVNIYCQKKPSKPPVKQTIQNNSSQISTSESDYIVSDFIRINPNPFVDFIEIDLLDIGTGAVEINILSIVGKVVKSFNFPADERFVLNLSDLEKGIYLLKVNNGKSACVKRIFHQ